MYSGVSNRISNEILRSGLNFIAHKRRFQFLICLTFVLVLLSVAKYSCILQFLDCLLAAKLFQWNQILVLLTRSL